MPVESVTQQATRGFGVQGASLGAQLGRNILLIVCHRRCDEESLSFLVRGTQPRCEENPLSLPLRNTHRRCEEEGLSPSSEVHAGIAKRKAYPVPILLPPKCKASNHPELCEPQHNVMRQSTVSATNAQPIQHH